MSRQRILRCWALGAAVIAACTDSGDKAPATFDEVFQLQRLVELEEADPDVIVDVSALTVDSHGVMYVADRRAGRIRIFNPDGTIRQVVGRFGDGPGELKQPQGVAIGADDAIYVVQAGSPKLSVFDSTGEFREARNLPGFFGFWVAAVSGQLVVGIGTESERYVVFSHDGQPVARFAADNELIGTVPYWSGATDNHATLVGGRVFVAEALFPVIRVFNLSGDSLFSFGSPSSRWEPPSRPERGAFVGPGGMERAQEWMASFTIMTELTAADSVIIAQYGRWAPTPSDFYGRAYEYVDVYTLEGIPIATELPLETPVLYGDSLLYVLEKGPPDPWTIGVYRRLRPNE